MLVFLILDLNVVKDEIFLISFGSLDHRYGRKYLIECLPYLTVLKFGISLNSIDLYVAKRAKYRRKGIIASSLDQSGLNKGV